MKNFIFFFFAIFWVCQAQGQSNNSYALVDFQTNFNFLDVPVQIDDLIVFSAKYEFYVFDPKTQLLSAPNINCYPAVLNSQGSFYCTNIPSSVQLVDPTNSFNVLEAFSTNTSGYSSTVYANQQGDLVVFQIYSWGSSNTILKTFNTITNQFECSPFVPGKFLLNYPIRYAEGYVVAYSDSIYLEYFSCNGTVLAAFQFPSNVLYIGAFNSSSVILICFGSNMQAATIGVNTSSAGDIYSLSNLTSYLSINDTHFIVTDRFLDTLETFLEIYYIDSDLNLVQTAAISIPYNYELQNFFQGNGTVIVHLNTIQIALDLETFAVTEVRDYYGLLFPDTLLGNGSTITFLKSGYFILYEGIILANSSYGLVNCYVDPTISDFIWVLTADSRILMIQKSTSLITTVATHIDYSGLVNVTIASVGVNSQGGYSFTIADNSQAFVFADGIQQETIPLSSIYYFVQHTLVVATDYQEGILYFLVSTASGVYLEEYNYYNGYQIASVELVSASLTSVGKINDEYGILTVSTVGTEVLIIDFQQGQVVFSTTIPAQSVNQIVPLGVDLNSDSIAQAYAITYGKSTSTTANYYYAAYDTQGNQLGEPNATVLGQLSVYSNTSVALYSLLYPQNYHFMSFKIFQYNGTSGGGGKPKFSPIISSIHRMVLLISTILFIGVFA